MVLAIPLTSQTKNLFGSAELDLMKSTASLINICRGAVVNEDCLYQALKNRSIRGACIDVFQDEKPLPRNSRFYKLPNILITSFSTYYSQESGDDQMNLFFDNLERFVSDKPLLNAVDKTLLNIS